jgi:hypothetical protein
MMTPSVAELTVDNMVAPAACVGSQSPLGKTL